MVDNNNYARIKIKNSHLPMKNSYRKSYYVYILSNDTGTIYTGVTGNLIRRLEEHKLGVVEGFTARYKIHRLIYFEETNNLDDALEREKQIKGWTRKKKLALVRTINPKFEDLSLDL